MRTRDSAAKCDVMTDKVAKYAAITDQLRSFFGKYDVDVVGKMATIR